MGGVDRADQLRSYYVGRQSRKSYKYLFWFSFNLAACNAYILESESRVKVKKIFSILSWESYSSAISTPENDPQAMLCHLSLGPRWPIFPPRLRAVRGSASTAKQKGRKLWKTIQSKQNLCQQCRVVLCQDQCFCDYHNEIWFTSLTWIFFSMAAIVACNVKVGFTSMCYNFALLKLCTVYNIYYIEYWIMYMRCCDVTR